MPTTARISDDSINSLRLDVGADAAGATVTFHGVVRDHDGGRDVRAIEYIGHPSAGDVIAAIVEEAAMRDGVISVGAVHRVGSLGIGDVALVAAVSAAHRAEAFGACGWLVDEIKARLPVWKNQVFADGTTEWTGCP